MGSWKQAVKSFQWFCRSRKLPDRNGCAAEWGYILPGGAYSFYWRRIIALQERRKRKKTLQIGRIVIEHWQMVAVVLALYDFAAVCIGYFLALFLRYDCAYNTITEIFLNAYLQFILPWAAVSILIFVLFRMYNSMWRFASFIELVRTFLGSLTSSLLHALLITVIFTRMPVSLSCWFPHASASGSSSC